MRSSLFVPSLAMEAIVPLTKTAPMAFETCHNSHKGPVFIVASGQSAKDFPLSEFSNVPMITMNGAISIFKDLAMDPFFYICTDPSFPEQQRELFKTALKCSKNVALRQNFLNELDDVEGYSANGHLYLLEKATSPTLFKSLFHPQKDLIRTYSPISRRKNSLGFSKDMSQGFFDARTVAYAALQLAYHIGFETIFLVGVDMIQSTGRFYETQQSKVSPCGLDKYYESRILPAFELMSQKVVSDKFRVFNLSANSRIPESIVPKINLNDARRLIANSPAAC